MGTRCACRQTARRGLGLISATPRVNGDISGQVAPGFEPVALEFRRNFDQRAEVGAAFAVVQDGRSVVDLWGGVADRDDGRRWREDTLQLIWSGTKGLVAICVLMLIERGLLELDESVAHYWPEFAQNGKEQILVRHVVSHTAGLPGISKPVSAEQFVDSRVMSKILEAERPLWPPGSRFFYHAHTYGWLCAEIVRRIDGRTVGEFFASEIATPLALDLWIGLPPQHGWRVSRLHLWSRWEPRRSPEFDAVAQRVWLGPELVAGRELEWNAPAFQASEIPSANAIGTARSIARLYGCLARGGTFDGIQILKAETIQGAQECLATGHDPITRWPKVYGVGFELQNIKRQFGPATLAFGHGGAGGSLHGAWPAERVGFSYVMNEMRDQAIDSRAAALLRALYSALNR